MGPSVPRVKPKGKPKPRSKPLGVTAQTTTDHETITVHVDRQGRHHVTRTPLPGAPKGPSGPSGPVGPRGPGGPSGPSTRKHPQRTDFNPFPDTLVPQVPKPKPRKVAKPGRRGPYSKGWVDPRLGPEPVAPKALTPDETPGWARDVGHVARGVAHWAGSQITPWIDPYQSQHAPRWAGPVGAVVRSPAVQAVGLAGRVSRAGLAVTLGPDLLKALEGKKFSDKGLTFDLAALLPVFKVGKVPEAVWEASKVLRAGEGLGEAASHTARVLREGANPVDRVLKYGPLEWRNPASRSFVLRSLQGAMDRAAQRAIIRDPLIQGRIAAPYVQHFTNTARFYKNLTERLPAEILRGYKLSNEERFAAEMVAHETKPADWIANNEKLLTESGLSKGDKQRLQNEIDMVKKASSLVREIPAHQAQGVYASGLTRGTTPVFSHLASQKLRSAFEDLHAAATMRAEMAKDPRLGEILGHQPLTAEREARRLSAPGRFRLGARWEHETAPLTEDTRPNALVQVNGKYPGKYLGAASSKTIDKRVAEIDRQIAKHRSFGSPNSEAYDQAQIKRLEAEKAGLLAHSKANPTYAEVMHFGKGGGTFVKPVPLSDVREIMGGSLKGAEHFTGGRVYIPSSSVAKRWYQRQASFGGETLPRKVAGGSEFRHPYTGALAEKALEVHDPTQLGAKAYNDMQRLNSAARELEGFRGVARSQAEIGRTKLAKPGIGARGVVPIRLTKASPLSQETQVALAELRNPEAVDEIMAGVLGKTAMVHADEIGFLPKAIVGDLLRKPPSDSEVLRFIKDMSLFVKNLIVYTKFPGHIPPRLASNEAMAVVQQGLNHVPNAYSAIQLYRRYPQVGRMIDAAMGSKHAFRSFAQEEGHQISERIGEALARPIVWTADRAPRATSLVEEVAQEMGRRMSPDEMAKEITRLYHAAPGTAEAHQWRMIVQRARRAAGEYGRANSLERKIAPFVFLYQWGKVAINITAKSALEHPVRSAAIAGSVYKYAYDPANKPWEQFGVPLPGNRIANITTSLPFSTPHEYAMDAYNFGRTVAGGKPQWGEGLGQLVNPFFPMLIGSATGYDPITGKPSGGAYGAFMSLLKQSPPGALGMGKKSFEERLGKFLLGNWYPQHLSPTGPLSNLPRSITPDQRKRIEAALKRAEEHRKAHQGRIDAALKRAKEHQKAAEERRKKRGG